VTIGQDKTCASARALFLDRDGVINVDREYVHRVDQFEFMPGIFKLARFSVQDLGWLLIVITNQSGIGRGYFDEAEYLTLTEWMCERFRREHAKISKVYHCPFHPEHGIGEYRVDHDWRKPKPGMILQAASEFDLDLSRCAMMGDKISDIKAAAAAGIQWRIRLDANSSVSAATDPPHLVARNLEDALVILKEHCR